MAISQVFVEVIDVLAHLQRAGEEKPSDSLAAPPRVLPLVARAQQEGSGICKQTSPSKPRPFKMVIPESSLRKAASHFPNDLAEAAAKFDARNQTVKPSVLEAILYNCVQTSAERVAQS